MRTFITTVALASSILGANAINLVERTPGLAPKVVQHRIQRRHVADPVKHDRLRSRRSDAVSAGLTNSRTEGLYLIDVEVGTPAQSLKVQLDTGSSDLWVNTPSSRYCSDSANGCSDFGLYTANDSSTYQYANSKFEIAYVDGTGIKGDYAADTVSVAGVTIKDQIFGIGYVSTDPIGILGVGYPQDEAIVSLGYLPYVNVPANLAKTGEINSNAYSLFLDDLDASTGSIIFGGVDTEQYTGNLQTIPIIPGPEGKYKTFTVALTEVGANGKTGSISSNKPVGVVLDAGTTQIYLPEFITKGIFDEVNAKYDASAQRTFIDCSTAQQDITFDFTFSGATVQVPISELNLGQESTDSDTCIFGIQPTGSGIENVLLGDTFLRSAYVVYDIANNEVSLAQSKFTGGSSSNLMEISGSVPGATKVKNPTTQVPSASAVGRLSNAAPTAALGYNMALVGAAAAAVFAF